jgi:magnesium-protoporphyrin IX monomethyl ester (oxidative) cyclase
MAQVCLVQMPYNSVAMPSLALGLLSSYVKEHGLGVQVMYANMAFADEIGLDIYRVIEDANSSHLLGDWTFSAALFPKHGATRAAGEAYLEEWGVKALFPGFVKLLSRANPQIDLKDLLLVVRDKATAFVERQARSIVGQGAQIVGCTSMFQQNCASLALLKRIKELDPAIVTLMGGPNCQDPMGKTIHRLFPWVDYTVTGEADGFFGDLCQQIVDRDRRHIEIPLPPGVYGPQHRREQVVSPAAPIVKDMDKTAVPDYGDYFVALAGASYEKYVTPALLIETSRGCWWGVKNHCTFCGANGYGMTFRSKSPERALDEIRQLHGQYGNNRFNVADNILDVSYLRTVLPRLAALDQEYYFFYQVKANLTREHLELMSDAGVRWLQPGIESLDDTFLRMVKKGTTAAINIHALRLSLEYGIRCFWNILFGIPGEQDEWYRELVDIIPQLFHLEPPGGFGPIRFDRFSPYYEHAAEYGLELRPFNSYQHVYPFPDRDMADLAYFFQRAGGDNESQNSPRFKLRAHAFQLFDQWRQHFWSTAGLTRPVLRADDAGDHTLVEDTRPIAVAGLHRLEGLEHRVHQVLDRPIPRGGIAAALEKAGHAAAPEDVAVALAALLERKLVLEVSGRCLALAVRKSMRPFAAAEHSPLGTLALNRLFKDLRETSLAVTYGRQAEAPLHV